MTIDGINIFFKFVQYDGKRHSKKQKLHLEATEKYKVDFLPCQFSTLQGFNKKSGGRSKRRGSRYQREEES